MAETSKKLADCDQAAKDAQKVQDEKQAKLDDLAKENQQLKDQVAALEKKIREAETEYQKVMAEATAHHSACGIECRIM